MTTRIKGIILILAIILTTITVCISATANPDYSNNIVSEKTEIKYFLGDFGGKLAIFKSNLSDPIEILDVEINSLPERDIEKIKSGIFSDSLNEIMLLAEDYE